MSGNILKSVEEVLRSGARPLLGRVQHHLIARRQRVKAQNKGNCIRCFVVEVLKPRLGTPSRPVVSNMTSKGERAAGHMAHPPAIQKSRNGRHLPSEQTTSCTVLGCAQCYTTARTCEQAPTAWRFQNHCHRHQRVATALWDRHNTLVSHEWLLSC